ncbi:MAG: toll/interleukin-1 receptor domain-containing protein [Gammaproteobacteria bacterium]|nr:toll/interleukin-1 receptor domain-containing protein [Gammaproteobacteria bacterium]
MSYAHDDDEAVYGDLADLNDQGFRIWFDDGISPGHSWPEALADAIDGCSLFLFFVSDHSVSSAHCQRELHFAMDGDKPCWRCTWAKPNCPEACSSSLAIARR